MLDQLLQTGLQADFKNRYASLRGEEHEASEADRLIAELRGNFTLRRFDFPEGIDANIREQTEEILFRNQLYDATFNYSDPKEMFKKFSDIYTTIPPEKCQSCLEGMERKTQILALLKKDVNPMVCAELRRLDEPHRIKLLTYSLIPETNALAKATLISKLIDIGELFGSEEDELITAMRECIWRAFDWRAYNKWSFEQYVGKLRNLRKRAHELESPITPEKIDEVLQVALQESLSARYKCLREEELDSVTLDINFSRLKRRVNSKLRFERI